MNRRAASIFLLGAALGGATALAAAPPLVLDPELKPAPDIQFTSGEGKARSLSEFRGKVVLLNLWAIWCAPCRKEMLALDRLQVTLGGPDFEVVALSIDRQGLVLGRKDGPAEWDSPESAAFLKAVVTQPKETNP